MRQPRRLDAPTGQSAYSRAQRAPLRYLALSEADFRDLKRHRPGYVVEDENALLIAHPRRLRIDLHYAFSGHDAFVRRFPDMLRRVLPAVRQEEAPLGLRFRLTDRTSRPYVEPVLFAQAFELSREWMEMRLAEFPDAQTPSDEVAAGFLLRPARREDAEDIAELDALVFPSNYVTPDVARDLAAEAPLLRVLEDTSAGRAIGFLHLSEGPGGAGYVSTIAVHPQYQRRGLGEGMMRWALAWFGSRRLRRASLTVSTDNAPAIALYRKLGFAPQAFGLDYHRPIDEEEARQILERGRAAHIRVRQRS